MLGFTAKNGRIRSVYRRRNAQTHFESIVNTLRWNIAVLPEADQFVRMFIAARGGGRKGDLSRFIEEAVRNAWLKAEQGVSFEDVVYHIMAGNILETIDHPNQDRYLG